MTTYRSALPVWIQALDGNTNDSRAFPSLVEAYLAQFREVPMPYLVADRALYTEENLQRLSTVKWLTRVPERVGLARHASSQRERRGDATRPPGRVSLFAGVHHLGRDTPALAGGLVGTSGTTGAGDPAEAGGKRRGRERRKSLAGAVPSGNFSSPEEAGAAVQALEQQVGAITGWACILPAGEGTGRLPGASSGGWAVPQLGGLPPAREAAVEKAEAIAAVQKALGKFILATNELDEQQLPAEEMLRAYKGRAVGPERGFSVF